MKEIIKQYFPLALTALCAVLAISILFSKITTIGNLFSTLSPNDYSTQLGKQIDVLNNAPLPTLNYVSSPLTVGDANVFGELFSLSFSDGTKTSLTNSSNASLYLVDIKNQSNASVLTRLSSDDIEALDTFPTPAIYDTEHDLLYFQNSGIYTLCIRLYFEHYSGILYECQIPVETR
ncbi:MAG: hypothetical protein IJO60_02155 [Agathobacter sp.]|nr:hypothetical protein [Agathobacter sp.]